MKKYFTYIFIILTANSFSQGVPNNVPKSGLVVWYPFNGNANDESGNNNNGTVINAISSHDRFETPNSSYYFNGTNARIQVNNSISLNIHSGQSLTISVWVKHDLNSTNIDKYIISKYDGNISSGAQYGLGTGWASKGYTTTQTGPEIRNHIELRGNRVLNDGKWHHIVYVWQNGGTASLYVDKVLDVSKNHGLIGSISNSLNLQIGCGANLAQYFTGSIDDIAIWNRALSEREIQLLFTSPHTITADISKSAPPNQRPAESINPIIDTLSLRKIFKSNSKVKLSNGRIYEGEYTYVLSPNNLNEIDTSTIERNGNGTTYWANSNIVSSKGNYLNDQLHGIGSKYYQNGKLKYEGNFLNGKENGIGKAYDSSGILCYDGNFLNGKPTEHEVFIYKGDKKKRLPNGIGKEYYKNGKIFYEGGFLDGKYSGKGRMNDYNGNLIFEGDFLDDKPNGIGKEYYENGKVHFEGEWRNGLMNGIGKAYYQTGAIGYEGYFVDGNLSGIGKDYTKDGKLQYEGGFLKNKYSGFGKMYFDDELKYVGEFNDGLPNGIGKEYSNEGKLLYDGNYSEGFRNGLGTTYFDDGSKIIGEFKDGLPNGSGKEYTSDGKLLYEGNFVDGEHNGFGTFYTSAGKYVGEFIKDKANGKGKTYSNEGVILYEGDFQNNLPNGFGKKYSQDGKLIYEGNFVDGEYHGFGSVYDPLGKVGKYVGEFLKGKPNGKGKLYSSEGLLIYEGDFQNSLPNGLGKLYSQDGKLAYDGDIKNGEMNGYGRQYSKDGNLLYEGNIVDGKHNGYGTIYGPGLRISGIFNNGDMNGEFTITDETTGKSETRSYKNGKLVSQPNIENIPSQKTNDNEFDVFENAIKRLTVSERNYFESLMKQENTDPSGKSGKHCGYGYSKCKWCGKSIQYLKTFKSRIETLQQIRNPLFSAFTPLLGIGLELNSAFSGESKEQMLDKLAAEFRNEIRLIQSGNLYTCEGNIPDFCSEKCKYEKSIRRY